MSMTPTWASRIKRPDLIPSADRAPCPENRCAPAAETNGTAPVMRAKQSRHPPPKWRHYLPAAPTEARKHCLSYAENRSDERMQLPSLVGGKQNTLRNRG